MQAFPHAAKLPTFLESIKFSHSVFALPFALVGLLLASGGLPDVWMLFWVIIACVSARTAAMAFNRIADLPFDARNPRTQNRALVTGDLDVPFMWKMLGISSLVFFLSAAMLNTTCLLLSAPVLAILFLYSLSKRVTDLSHFILGFALALAPMGAWIAVRETLSATPVLLSIAVLLWVAGFDILYSCQDYDVDKSDGELHSIPKTLGIEGAMRLSHQVHAASALFFVLFWFSASLGMWGFLGVVGIGVLLWHQHRLVKPEDLSRINAAFFTTNGMLSIGFLIAIILDQMGN